MNPSKWLAAVAWLNGFALAWGLLFGLVERDRMAATILIVFFLIAIVVSAIASGTRRNVSRPVIRRSDE